MPYDVLIVDDSGSMRKVIKKVLQLSGFQVGECLEAANGRDALKVLARHEVDLILSDINMPEMNGVDLLRVLRRQAQWHDLPVVFITTETSETALKEALALGAKGYLRKPFRPESILSLLTEIMGEPDGFEVASDNEGCDF